MTVKLLIAYVPWLARDIIARAFVPLALALIFGGMPIGVAVKSRPSGTPLTPDGLADVVGLVFVNVVPLCLTLGAFLFMTRSIAEDRERQYVRFLFAHPVRPADFYLTRFVVGLVVFAACFVPVPLAARAFGADVSIVNALMALVAMFVLIGGLTTLCAALTNKDGVALIATYVGVQLLQRLASQDILYDWARPFARGLPPIGSLDPLLRSLLSGGDWPVTDLVHVIGYGLGLLAAGLLVIRRAPLVR